MNPLYDFDEAQKSADKITNGTSTFWMAFLMLGLLFLIMVGIFGYIDNCKPPVNTDNDITILKGVK